jgi:CDP-diacylglycerol--glycerol-3-phosphate 3-phosphatidyltransferase
VRGELLLADLKRLGRRPADTLARLLSRTPLTPNAITVLAFVLNVGVAAVLAAGYHLAGGILVLLVGALDMLDGALARLTGRVTRFGSFLDSTLDRFSEAALFFGLLVFYVQRQATMETLLVFAVFVGSVMISYIKARAEALQIKCEVGVLARPERIIVLAAGLLLGQMPIFLWILLALTYFTVVQRMVHVWRTSSTE